MEFYRGRRNRFLVFRGTDPSSMFINSPPATPPSMDQDERSSLTPDGSIVYTFASIRCLFRLTKVNDFWRTTRSTTCSVSSGFIPWTVNEKSHTQHLWRQISRFQNNRKTSSEEQKKIVDYPKTTTGSVMRSHFYRNFLIVFSNLYTWITNQFSPSLPDVLSMSREIILPLISVPQTRRSSSHVGYLLRLNNDDRRKDFLFMSHNINIFPKLI